MHSRSIIIDGEELTGIEVRVLQLALNALALSLRIDDTDGDRDCWLGYQRVLGHLRRRSGADAEPGE